MAQKKEKSKMYNKLIELDDKYQLQQAQKIKVTSVLENQVDYLLDKKEKEKEKRKRIKQLQQEFQRKRLMQIQHFQHKIQQSQKTKESALKQKISKNKKNLEHIQKVHKKFIQQNVSNVQKDMEKRKQFYSSEITRSPKFNAKTQTQQNFKKNNSNKTVNQQTLKHSRTSNQMNLLNKNVEQQMKKIDQRLSKAKNNHQIYQNQVLSKLFQKQKHQFQIQQKIKSNSALQQQKNYKEVYGKNQHILEAERKVKDMTQKHLSDRRKSFQDKIKKLHQNIKFIESEKTQKYTSMQTKFNKIYENNSLQITSRNNSRANQQRVLLNNLKLEGQNKLKAQQILKKHSDITAKNKIYKEKKDLILQTIKKVNPEINE